MFLSSLVESSTSINIKFDEILSDICVAIALPIGISDKVFLLSPSTQEILEILDNAKKL
jgi:hypothetical protein